jgi:hypothetical protein
LAKWVRGFDPPPPLTVKPQQSLTRRAEQYPAARHSERRPSPPLFVLIPARVTGGAGLAGALPLHIEPDSTALFWLGAMWRLRSSSFGHDVLDWALRVRVPCGMIFRPTDHLGPTLMWPAGVRGFGASSGRGTSSDRTRPCSLQRLCPTRFVRPSWRGSYASQRVNTAVNLLEPSFWTVTSVIRRVKANR